LGELIRGMPGGTPSRRNILQPARIYRGAESMNPSHPPSALPPLPQPPEFPWRLRHFGASLSRDSGDVSYKGLDASEFNYRIRLCRFTGGAEEAFQSRVVFEETRNLGASIVRKYIEKYFNIFEKRVYG